MLKFIDLFSTKFYHFLIFSYTYKAVTVPKNDPKVEVCVTEQPTIPGHVYTLGGSETTFHKIFTHIGGPRKPKKPRNFLENWLLLTIMANGFR